MVSANLYSLLGIDRESLNQIIDLVPAPVFVTDLEGIILDYNKAFEDFFDHNSSSLLGMSLLDVAPYSLSGPLRQAEKDLSENGTTEVRADLTDDSETLTVVRIQQCSFADAQGVPAGSVGLIFDITEDSRRVRRLQKLSMVDELTGLTNRRYGTEKVQSLIQQAERNQFELSLLMLDLDDFKNINDQQGHQAGDLMLREVADIIRELCRGYDLAFRYGGDEIIVCLSNTSHENARRFGERIREAVEKHPFRVNQETCLNMTLSIGVATYPQDGESLKHLMTVADDALYSAKHSGRNKVVDREKDDAPKRKPYKLK